MQLAVRLQEDRMESQESQEPQPPPAQRGKGSGCRPCGEERPKITKNLKLQGEVEGSVVGSHGELLREGKEKFYSQGMENEAREGGSSEESRGKGFSHGNTQVLNVLGPHVSVCLWKNPDGGEENIPIS